MLILITIFGILLIPSNAFAWGPLTHIFIGNEILTLSSLLPPAVYSVIKQYREDFLYGNIIADLVIGKKYLPPDKNVHGWDFGFNLLDSAQNNQQKAFVYGYLVHLAADTVAHEFLTHEKKNIAHTLYELKADSLLHKKYWLQAVTIKKNVQRRNDEFLGNSISRLFLSFRTFKRIFKGITFFSLFTSEGMSNFMDRHQGVIAVPEDNKIKNLRQQSLVRAIDVLNNGRLSSILEKNPSGNYKEVLRYSSTLI
ncbi:MAG: zinc dependent phospholipase C family protein [Nitrospirae bacterium]|nr:zinc dependent phospholipase C family protein [Nitrospirota bacterium]